MKLDVGKAFIPAVIIAYLFWIFSIILPDFKEKKPQLLQATASLIVSYNANNERLTSPFSSKTGPTAVASKP